MTRIALVLLVALAPLGARAELTLASPEGLPEVPGIPDSWDLELTAEEWAEIQKGEIVIQLVQITPEDRVARAIGYVDASPLAMFDIVTDSDLAQENFDEIDEVQVLERFPWADGAERPFPYAKRFRAVVDPAWFLPNFEYVMVAVYPDPPTGQTFTQVEGDFDKNHGGQSFLWDPERGETLAVFTFAFAMKGILSIIPESLILRLASQNLPAAIRRLEWLAGEVHTVRDPARGDAIAGRWTELRPRIEAGELPGRLWSGYPPVPAPDRRGAGRTGGPVKIPADVLRIDAPGGNFGVDDRSVACVLAGSEPTIENAVPIEEYIVEQLTFDVAGEIIVIRDERVTPHLRSYQLDESLDVPFDGRPDDDIEALDYGDFIERQTRAARSG